MDFSKKNNKNFGVYKNGMSKIIVLILGLLLTSSFSFAQNNQATKISTKLQKQMESTPVGFIKNGKLKVNQKVLNPKICSGEKITSFKIKKHKNLNLFFLVRQAKLKNGFFSSFIALRESGGKLLVMHNAEGFITGCYSTTCQSCGEALSQTGMAFCECESTGGDCEEYDHCPDEVTLSTLFL